MHTNNRTLDYLTEEAVTSLPGSIFSTTHSCTTTLIVMLNTYVGAIYLTNY